MEQDKSKVWAKRIKDWEQSGLSQAAFCRERGLTPSNFHSWKARLKQQAQEAEPNPRNMVEVTRIQPERLSPPAPPLRLEVNASYVLELAPGFDEALLLKTLRVLERL